MAHKSQPQVIVDVGSPPQVVRQRIFYLQSLVFSVSENNPSKYSDGLAACVLPARRGGGVEGQLP